MIYRSGFKERDLVWKYKFEDDYYIQGNISGEKKDQELNPGTLECVKGGR